MDLEQVNQDLEFDIKDIEEQYFAILRKMESMNKEISHLKEKQSSATDFQERFKLLNTQNEQHQAKLDKLQNKLSKCNTDAIRKLRKKVEYRDAQLENKTKEIKKLQESKKSLQARLDAAVFKLEEKSKQRDSLLEIKCLITHKRQLQFKPGYFKKIGHSVSIADSDSHLKEISELQEKIAILNRENKELEELVCILQVARQRSNNFPEWKILR